MINLSVKFNVHCSYAEQVIVLKVADRRTDGQTRLVTTIGIRQNFGWGLKIVFISVVRRINENKIDKPVV